MVGGLSPLSLEIRGLDKTLERFQKLAEIPDQLKKIVKSTAESVERDAKREAPVGVSGFLRTAIRTEYLDRGLTAKVFAGGPGSPAPYAPYVEFSRGAGKMPPDDTIRLWVLRKGLPLESVFPIRRSIGLRGTKSHPFLIPAWEKHRDRFASQVQRELDKLIGR